MAQEGAPCIGEGVRAGGPHRASANAGNWKLTLVAGPYHPSLSQLVQSAIALDMATHLLHLCGETTRVRFLCHPKEMSTVRGQQNGNIFKLRDRFGLNDISLEAREDVPRECLVLQTSDGEHSMHRREFYGAHTETSTLSIPRFYIHSGHGLSRPVFGRLRDQTPGRHRPKESPSA